MKYHWPDKSDFSRLPPTDHGHVPQKLPCFTKLAAESVFRNKIPETRKSGCLCNGMKAPDHEQKLHLDGTAKPNVQKTLDRHGDLRHLCGRSRQRRDLDDECF